MILFNHTEKRQVQRHIVDGRFQVVTNICGKFLTIKFLENLQP